MSISYIATLCAAAAAWIFGAVWYSALSRQYQTSLGKTPGKILSAGRQKPPIGALVSCFVAELLMAVVLANLMHHLGFMTAKAGAMLGTACWLGFVATTVTVNNEFPGRSTMLTVIDSGHWLGVLLIEGLVIGAFS